jgi:peptidyl-prolyl cis-trans isomerase D
MLQAIRDKAQGWIAWAIVILISIPFALWGIQEYLGVGGEREAAVVNGEPITERTLDQRLLDFRQSMRATLGEAYRAELFEGPEIRRRVLDAMIEERVLAENAMDWNLQTSDAQARGFIASIPAFQRDGRFDNAMYEATVRNQGMTAAGFEQLVRQDMVLDQLRAGIRDTAFVTEAQLSDWVRLDRQQRSLAYVRIPAAAYRDQVVVDADALREYYDDNRVLYATPERVRLDYLLLDAATLGDLVEVNEAALREYFDGHRAEFVGREERQVRHILLTLPPDADAAARAEVVAQISALRDQLQAGADFAELAREHSQDPGSAEQGGDLGWIERGIMVPPFEEAAFSLAPGVVSEPVETAFGYHLVEVTDVRGSTDVTFEAVRDDVEQAYRRFEAENLYFDYAERLAETAYESPSSLVPAAEALGLQVRSTDWVTRSGSLPPPLSSPRIIEAAFSDDVLIEGHNSELIETDEQTAVVVRVAEHEPAGSKPFDEHRAEIEQDYVQREASKLAESRGQALLQQLEAGDTTLATVAADNGWSLQEADAVTRNDPQLDREVRLQAFAMTPPEGDASAYDGRLAVNGDYLLVEVREVVGGVVDELDEVTRGQLVEETRQQAGSAEMGFLTEALRAEADVEIKIGSDE